MRPNLIASLLFMILISCSPENREINKCSNHENIFPNWIKGTWQNKTESNTRNFEYWTFLNDSIYVAYGYPINKSNTTCLNLKHSEYALSTEKNDSVFIINFTKKNDSICYEFIKQSFNTSEDEKNSFSYSIKRNGKVEREHSTSCNLTFQRVK